LYLAFFDFASHPAGFMPSAFVSWPAASYSLHSFLSSKALLKLRL
jgi:hypothetical protein